MPTSGPEDCVARMNEFNGEIERLRISIENDPSPHGTGTSIRGNDLQHPSLLLITYVKPAILSKLWQPPPFPIDVEKAFPDLDDYINDYLEDPDRVHTGESTAWQAFNTSLEVFNAFDKTIDRVLFHHPGRSWEEPLPYDVLG